MGALGMKPSTPDDDLVDDAALPTDDKDVEPTELELAAAKEFQAAAKGSDPAALVRAFRGLKAACDADYSEE